MKVDFQMLLLKISLSLSLISLCNWMMLVYLRGNLTFCRCFIVLNLLSHIQYEDKQKSVHPWMDMYFWNLWLTTFKNIRLWGFIDRKKPGLAKSASCMPIWCDLSICKNENVNSKVHCCRMSDNFHHKHLKAAETEQLSTGFNYMYIPCTL